MGQRNSTSQRANSRSNRDVGKRYADLAQFVALAGLLRADIKWPEPQTLAPNPMLTDLKNSQSPEIVAQAFDLEIEALRIRDQILDPMWRAACAVLAPRPGDALDPSYSPAAIDVAVIRRPNGPPYVFNDASDLYAAAYAVRQALTLLANRDAHPRGPIVSLNLPATPVHVQIMRDGTMAAALDLFRDFLMPALDGRDVDRLRLCPVEGCGKVFIARRSDQFGCSHQHALIVRAKKFRDKNPSYYDAKERKQRRERKTAKVRREQSK
jgi:hypothetical protein